MLLKDINHYIELGKKCPYKEIAKAYNIKELEVLAVYDYLCGVEKGGIDVGYKDVAYYTEEEMLSFKNCENGLWDFSKEFRWQTLSVHEKEFYLTSKK